MLGYGLIELKRARESEDWPMLEAKVLASSVKKYRGVHSGTSYGPVVRYQYQYEGVVHEGKRFMFSGLELTTHSRAEAEDFIAPFESGARITIRVSPKNPQVSVIAPGVDRRVWITLFIGSMLVFMGLGGLLGWFR
jgi:hypothetical protein